MVAEVSSPVSPLMFSPADSPADVLSVGPIPEPWGHWRRTNIDARGRNGRRYGRAA
jgi:hypothetical protein